MPHLRHKALPAKIFFSALLVAVFLLPRADAARAAVLSLSPASAQVSVGSTVSLRVVVNTAGAAINNANATVNFPSSLLQVASLSQSQSIFPLWVEEPAFSNSAGTVMFVGGVQNPGFTGSAGRIVSITFLAKKAGKASVTFSGASVLANDGLGTDVLTSSPGASITVTAAASVPKSQAPTEALPLAPIITSSTDPDQGAWYGTSTASVEWQVASDTTAVSMLVDQDPNGIPDLASGSVATSDTASHLADGISYFHVALKNAAGWGAVGSYKVQIDTVPPNPFSIVFPYGAAGTSQTPVASFSATDSLSGIDHYEMKIDDGQFAAVPAQNASSTSVTLPSQGAGMHTLSVQAVDRAGNETTETAQFTVEQSSFIVQWLIAITILVFLLILIDLLIFYLLYRNGRNKKSIDGKINRAEPSAYMAFDLLRSGVRDQIAALEKTQTGRQLTSEEEQVLKGLKENLDSTEEYLKRQITNTKL